ncbi:MAG: hypothetical protein R3C26_03230 [Calditrichia bacterium]
MSTTVEGQFVSEENGMAKLRQIIFRERGHSLKEFIPVRLFPSIQPV